MKDAELAWLAGYMEGEGCFFAGSHGPQRRKSVRVSCSIVTTDKDVAEKAATLMGVRKIYTHRLRLARKQSYSVYLGGDDAIALMKQLLPHMGERRTAKIKEVIAIASKRPGTPWGERQGSSKLTDGKVSYLRHLNKLDLPRGWKGALAAVWNVTPNTISNILSGRNWGKLQP